jgi:hypothetical protein
MAPVTHSLGDIDEIDTRIRELTLRLEELRLNLPAHSVKPEMLIAIERIEEEIELLRQRRRELMRENGRAT